MNLRLPLCVRVVKDESLYVTFDTTSSYGWSNAVNITVHLSFDFRFLASGGVADALGTYLLGGGLRIFGLVDGVCLKH